MIDLIVLDLADEKAAFCSRLLADTGATVIKIESPTPDSSRYKSPFYNHVPNMENSLHFWTQNRGKLGITLDLNKQKGRAIFHRLIQQADVVVESFPPDYLHVPGLDYDVLSAINPELIHCSVTGFGNSGPNKGYRSCDLVASASGGQMYICGDPQEEPLVPYGQQSYNIASLYAATGILIALHARRRSGKGQHIDISTQEAVCSALDSTMVRYFFEQTVSVRQGNRHWNNQSCVLPTSDGNIYITFGLEWDTLIELMHAEGRAGDLIEERWRNEEYRNRNLSHVISVLRSWTELHSTGELVELGQSMRFPWAPVQRVSQIANDPQLAERGYFVPVDHPEYSTTYKYPGLPFKSSVTPTSEFRRAPLHGEHNSIVYSEKLAFSEEEINALREEGVI